MAIKDDQFFDDLHRRLERRHGDFLDEGDYTKTGFGGGGGGSASAETSAGGSPRTPPQATTEEHAAKQRSLLNDIDHEAVVTVDFVDSKLGFAEAREAETGKRVTLTWNTRGFIKESLKAGDTLKAFVTHFQVATQVESVTR